MNSPGTGEFPAQMASNAENVSIWWRHHENQRQPNCPVYQSQEIQICSMKRLAEQCTKIMNKMCTARIILSMDILSMDLANEKRRYNVTSSLIGWAHAQNELCCNKYIFRLRGFERHERLFSETLALINATYVAIWKVQNGVGLSFWYTSVSMGTLTEATAHITSATQQAPLGVEETRNNGDPPPICNYLKPHLTGQC